MDLGISAIVSVKGADVTPSIVSVRFVYVPATVGLPHKTKRLSVEPFPIVTGVGSTDTFAGKLFTVTLYEPFAILFVVNGKVTNPVTPVAIVALCVPTDTDFATAAVMVSVAGLEVTEPLALVAVHRY
jgi:hypothetical protein